MSRVNLFSPPHKALRRLMSQISLLAGKIDYTNKNEVEQLKAKTIPFFEYLDAHAFVENEFILKPLQEKAPEAAQHDYKEHEELETQQKALYRELLALDGTQTPEEGHRFYLLFTKFQAAYLQHILHEEEHTQSLLWEHFTDEELLKFRGNFMEALTPEQRAMSLKYIIPAQAEHENIKVLRALKSGGMPTQAFDNLCKTFQTEMEVHEFDELIKKINHN